MFKVETIGDAYMVASGHEGCADHALRMTAMAVDMLDAVKGLEQELGTAIRVRIGMHTGERLALLYSILHRHSEQVLTFALAFWWPYALCDMMVNLTLFYKAVLVRPITTSRASWQEVLDW